MWAFMPITPFLAHQAFEPEIIETMSAAFVAACGALHLKIGDYPAARVVAQKVIELEQRGVRDPDMASHNDTERIEQIRTNPLQLPMLQGEI